MKRVDELEKRVARLENRNKKVEANKAWETSYTRRALLIIFTYLFIVAYLHYVVKTEPWLNAIVPSLGFLLSTLTLPYFKKLWGRYIYKK